MPIELPTLPVVISTAAIDSINPCAIGVLVLLLGVLSRHAGEKQRLLKIAGTYMAIVFAVYLLSGLGLIWFQGFLIEKGLAQVLGSIVGVFVIVLGGVEVKDFFFYGRGFSLMIPAKYAKSIKKRIEHISVTSAILLGGFVAIVELPCTGGPYLAITTMLARQFNFMAFIYLVLYNLVFVLPLVVITLMTYYGVQVTKIKKWRQEKRRWMRLATGLLMIGLGIYLLLFYLA